MPGCRPGDGGSKPYLEPARRAWRQLIMLGLSLAATNYTAGLEACPSFAEAEWPAMKGFLGHKRADLQLVAYDPKLGRWQPLALQIDPRNSEGRLAFFPTAAWLQEPIAKDDRLVLRREHFGSLKPGHLSWPCSAQAALALSDPAAPSRVAYLLACKTAAATPPQAPAPAPAATPSPPLAYAAPEQLLYSHHYSYHFRPDNHMLFEQIDLGQGLNRHLAAFDSDILIYAAVRRLMNLHFTAGDITSQIEKMTIGPLGINARVSFYLKILFLKLKLSLSTDVSFYADSANIPMVLYLPVAAASYLKPESGVFYSWHLAAPLLQKKRLLQMPELTPAAAADLLQARDQALRSTALSHCPADRNDPCLFTYDVLGEKGAAGLSMQLRIPAPLVAKGFFPYFVTQPATISPILGWGLKKEEQRAAQHQGLFFGTAGLDQGAHAWDFWLRLADNHPGGNKGLCPAPITLTPLSLSWD